MTPDPGGRGRGGGGGGGRIVGLVLVVGAIALSLRAPITSVGPVLDVIRSDLALSAAAAGLLGALPVLAFAAVSPLAPRLADAVGLDRALAFAAAVLVVGVAVRSTGSRPALFAGTVVLGAAIAVVNVLLPALLRRDAPQRLGAMTAFYTTVMGIVASTASGVAVPLAGDAGDGWRWSLGLWALPAAVGALVWLPRALRGRTPSGATRRGSRGAKPWRSARAWQVSLFMGLQSVGFYTAITWLPTVLRDHGLGAGAAGLWLVVFQLVALVAGATAPIAAARAHDQRRWAGGIGLTYLVGYGGLALVPALYPLWLVVAGLAAGASLSVALMLMSLRASDAREAAGLSAMAQTVGYALASAGPLLVGVLHDVSGGWTLPLALVACACGGQALAGRSAGRAGGLWSGPRHT